MKITYFASIVSILFAFVSLGLNLFDLHAISADEGINEQFATLVVLLSGYFGFIVSVLIFLRSKQSYYYHTILARLDGLTSKDNTYFPDSKEIEKLLTLELTKEQKDLAKDFWYMYLVSGVEVFSFDGIQWFKIKDKE